MRIPLLLAAAAVPSLLGCATERGEQTSRIEPFALEHVTAYADEPSIPRLPPPVDRTFVPPVPDLELQRHRRSGGPRPPRLRFGYVDYWDYPNEALPDLHQGIAAIRLLISETGRVERCEIVETSGWFTLDAASCVIPRRRFVYLPALDARGRPTRGTRTERIRWRLPRDEGWPTLIDAAPLPNFLLDEEPPP